MTAQPMPCPSDSPQDSLAAENIVSLLLRRTDGPRPAARSKEAGVWRDVPWSSVVGRVRNLSEGLVALGVEPGDRVAIWAPTRPEWSLADLAVLGARAVPVPVYPSVTTDEMRYVVTDCGAKVLLLDGDVADKDGPGRWTRLRGIRAQIPAIEHVIAFDLPTDASSGLLSLAELEERGRTAPGAHPHAVDGRAKLIRPDDLATIVYTSGTTGLPKGVRLSHGGWSVQARSLPQLDLLHEDDTALLFLPLAHVFGRAVEVAWVTTGCTLAYAEAVEKLVDNAAEVRATMLPAVPRIFEKAFAKVVQDGRSQPGLRGLLFRRAMRQFDRYAEARVRGEELRSPEWALLRRVVFGAVEKRLKARFGGRMRLFLSAGAPLQARIAVFFELCGLVVLEGYGLTETTGPTHLNRIQDRRPGTVGPPMPQCEVRLAEDGEILVRGPMVMQGYHGLADETAQVLDADGWFRTGDIGEIGEGGYLRITDRKKDLIKTATGKYVAPQAVENALKAEPLASQVVVLGDARPYVVALITLSDEVWKRWAAEQGWPQDESPARRPEVRTRLQAAVDAVNATLPNWSRVRRFAVLERDFTPETGELTLKLSVKRKVVATKYAQVIEGLYAEGGTA